jgi:hypothetical protein
MDELIWVFGVVSFSEFLLNAHEIQTGVRNAYKMLNRLTQLVCGEKLCECSSWKNRSFKYLNGSFWKLPTEHVQKECLRFVRWSSSSVLYLRMTESRNIISWPASMHKGIWNSIPTCAHYHTVFRNIIPVAVRSKAWVCFRLLAVIAGLNTARSMDVYPLRVLCV